jgi:hypothetical protein
MVTDRAAYMTSEPVSLQVARQATDYQALFTQYRILQQATGVGSNIMNLPGIATRAERLYEQVQYAPRGTAAFGIKQGLEIMAFGMPIQNVEGVVQGVNEEAA